MPIFLDRHDLSGLTAADIAEGVSDLAPTGPEAQTTYDAALRAIMFTDIVDSTGMTARLGDTRAVEMVRAHDAMVRRALKDKRGREVKHTGDGIMASFDETLPAVECARAIQQAFDAFNLASKEKLHIRIGLDVGEPLADSNDLFGTTVQTAARLCQAAGPDAILVSGAARDVLGSTFDARALGPRALKGLVHPIAVYEVQWR